MLGSISFLPMAASPNQLGAQYEPVAVWSRDSNRLYVIRARRRPS